MGVPTSEVGYTSAMPRREDHEVRKGHVGHWIKKNDLRNLLGKCKPDLRDERLSNNQHGSLSTLCRAIDSVSFLSRPATRQLSRKVPADAGCLCDKFAVLRETIKETLVRCLCTDWKDCSRGICWCLWHTALSHRHRVSSAHNTLHLSGSVNKPHLSGGVEFAARIVVTVFRHGWRLENCGVQTGWSVWSVGTDWRIREYRYTKK